MKKSHIVISSILIISTTTLFFILSPIKLGLPSTYKINNNLVDTSVKEITNNKEITITLTNKYQKTLYYGSEYSIEKLSFGIWRHILPKEEPIFHLMAYELPPNETKEIKIKWEYLYNDLPKGKYRVIKNITTIETEPEEKYYIAAYFEIK